MYATLTTSFWLSVAIPGAVSICLIAIGAAKRRYLVAAIGILGLLVTVGWLVLVLYIEAVVK